MAFWSPTGQCRPALPPGGVGGGGHVPQGVLRGGVSGPGVSGEGRVPVGPGLGQMLGRGTQSHLGTRWNKASCPRRASCCPAEAEFAVRSRETPEKVVPPEQGSEVAKVWNITWP